MRTQLLMVSWKLLSLECIQLHLDIAQSFTFHLSLPPSALRLFLNADSGLSRQLITSILTSLWAIQKYMRSQTTFQFYSSSVLIVYDARRLRQLLETQKRQSLSPNALETSSGTSSPRRTPSPVPSGIKTPETEEAPPPPATVYKKIQRCHSATNNYDEVSSSTENSLEPA